MRGRTRFLKQETDGTFLESKGVMDRVRQRLKNKADLHVLLLTSNDERGMRLLKTIEGNVPRRKLEVYGNIEGLSTRLRAPQVSAVVGILLALTETDEELLRIVGISSLLSDVRLILILPDRDDRTVAIGHMLHPRFLSYADADFQDVAAVLVKMISSLSGGSETAHKQGGADAGEMPSTSKGDRHYKKAGF